MLDNPQNYQVLQLKKFAQVSRYWEHFQGALDKLNELCGEKVSKDTFLRATVDCLKDGLVVVVIKKGQGEVLALGIVMAMNTSNPYHPPSLLIYAAYSTGDSSVIKYALAWLEEWGREHGFKELQAWSPRINGSAFYLFEKKWGFRRRSVHFTKAI
jgi:hypothetical protein